MDLLGRLFALAAFRACPEGASTEEYAKLDITQLQHILVFARALLYQTEAVLSTLAVSNLN